MCFNEAVKFKHGYSTLLSEGVLPLLASPQGSLAPLTLA